MRIISKIALSIKKYRKEIVLFVFIFLISSISFGIGYLMAGQFNHAPIIIEKLAGR